MKKRLGTQNYSQMTQLPSQDFVAAEVTSSDLSGISATPYVNGTSLPRLLGKLDVSQPAGRVAESLQVRDSKFVRQSQEQIGHWLGDVLDKSPRSQCATTRARKDDWQIGVCMSIAISISTTIDDH